jgi:hypothetical protein
MEIKIERASAACRVCSRPFRDGETVTAALRAGKEEGEYGRMDVCHDCWPKQDPRAFACHWLTQFSAKKRPALLDADVLWQALQRSLPTKDSAGQPDVAYVAALGLMRLKQLVMEDTEREGDVSGADGSPGAEILVFRDKGKPVKEYRVADPRLTEAQMESVQERLSEAAGGA